MAQVSSEVTDYRSPTAASAENSEQTLEGSVDAMSPTAFRLAGLEGVIPVLALPQARGTE
jgi:hypothetical protein